MSIWDVFKGGVYDPEDDRLAAPNEQEADNLPLHVERCALRYHQVRKTLARSEGKLNMQTLLLLALMIVVALALGKDALKTLVGML